MRLRRSWVLGVHGAAALVLLATPARAESALLLSPQGDDTLRADRAQAQRVLAQTLQAQGVRVVQPEAAVNDDLELSAAGSETCDAIECAAGRLQAVGADIAALLSVWAAPGAPNRPGNVFITLIDRGNARYPGRVKLEGHGAAALARAVKAALLEARALQLLGPGPWLRVYGDPEGAQVVIDGQLAGTLPYRAPLAAGRHTVEVRSPGHRSEVQTVDVPPSAARQVELEVKLAARGERHGQGPSGAAVVADAESAAAPIAEDGGDSRPVVGPLLLGGAGLVLVAADLVLVLSSDCDRHGAAGDCIEGYEVDEAMAITWAAVGASAIVSAVLWHMLGGDDPSPAEVAVLPRTDGAAFLATARF